MKELRPYQKADVQKLKNLNAVAILNEPRTGKTPTSLILYSNIKKILIVTTGSMLYKWAKEFKDWLQRPCLVLEGSAAKRKLTLNAWTDGLVITFDTLKMINRDLDEQGKPLRRTGALLDVLTYKPEAIIVDEYHRAKNHKSLRAKALFTLAKKIPKRAALTGTPAYSTQLDIYSLLHFLYPKEFPTWYKFMQDYCICETIYTPRGALNNPKCLSPAGEKIIQGFLDTIAVQRRQNDPDVMPWLPEKPLPEIVLLPLDLRQKKMLKDLEVYFETREIITQGVLDRITRYRQIISEPNILIQDQKGHSPKTRWILNAIKEYPNTPTLFFSNSTLHLRYLIKEIKKITDKVRIIEGATTKADRFKIEEEFQTGKVKFLLINTNTGQEGLTLDTAEWTVLIEQFPPVGSITQACERMTAATEDKAHIPKKITKLIMADSYDEIINKDIELNLSKTDTINNFAAYLNKRSTE